MAPKKKRTKEEIAAEKARREEEARLAEEERQRQEEEARRVAEQLEQRRKQLLRDFKETQDDRLHNERQDLVPFLQQLQQERSSADQQQAGSSDWQRYLSCNPLPDPRKRPDMNDFFNSLLESSDEQLSESMKECEACVCLARDCLLLAAEETMAASTAAAVAVLATGARAPITGKGRGSDPSSSRASAAGDADDAAALLVAKAQAATAAADARTAQYQSDAQQLYQHVRRKMDIATAHVLHCADEYADKKGDVLLTAQQGLLQWGLWVNVHKNPRFKLIDFGGLGMTVEIPKQIALASVAVRVQRRPYNEFQQRSSGSDADAGESGAAAEAGPACCLVPLGGVLQVDLLALSAPAKQSRGWTVRQVTPLSSNVSVVPYPIPPAGADLATWQPEEEPPPLTFSLAVPQQLLVPAGVRVGWWDEKRGAWSEEGISGVSYDASAGRLSFSSVHLGCLAMLHDTAAAVPYSSWSIRPAGLGDAQATISIQVQALSNVASGPSTGGTDVVLEVGRGTLALTAPALPQLSHLLGRALPPWQLLFACEEAGLKLVPGSDEAGVAGVQEKGGVTEGAMCADLALLCGTFLVASSRLNRAAGVGAALVRLSEVTDWEEGGRTAPQHAARIFRREAAEGERRVLVVRRQGGQGVMFVDGGDTRAEPPVLPDFSSVEGVTAAAKDAYCHLHASLLNLLAGPHAEVADHPRAPVLAATALGLERVRATDAVFSGTMQSVLQALRLFTFG